MEPTGPPATCHLPQRRKKGRLKTEEKTVELPRPGSEHQRGKAAAKQSKRLLQALLSYGLGLRGSTHSCMELNRTRGRRGGPGPMRLAHTSDIHGDETRSLNRRSQADAGEVTRGGPPGCLLLWETLILVSVLLCVVRKQT